MFTNDRNGGNMIDSNRYPDQEHKIVDFSIMANTSELFN